MFDNKDYFTIYDFVKAHYHFNDPEWDGEPLEPEKSQLIYKQKKEEFTGVSEKPFDEPCRICGYSPCRCDKLPKQMIKVQLADGKEREFQNIVSTTFWSPDGKPISAEQFLRSLFGTLPELFNSEDELRAIWSKPDTRKKLLAELSEKGFAKQQLREFQKILNAEKSDLYDVLAYIAFHSKMVERENRAAIARIYLKNYDPKQQEFLNFVLKQYVKQGVDELDDTKIGDLLLLKYHAIADAKKELGKIETIRNTFIGFQSYLYENRIAI